MLGKNQLRTVRFTKDESELVCKYLKQNHIFESFSALARVATLSFIQQCGNVQLQPVGPRDVQRPRFVWDYDLTEIQVREILATRGDSPKKEWLIARILREARFDETLRYLDPQTIARALPRLRLPSRLKQHWAYTLQRWGYDGG